MMRPTFIDSLERRTLFSTDVVTGYVTVGADGVAHFDPSIKSIIGYAMTPNGSSHSYITSGLRLTSGDSEAIATIVSARHGTFALPVIADDGSASVPGTSENDVITIERTTGIHEDANVDGVQADGEVNYINYIGADGKRHLSSYGVANETPTEVIAMNQSLISDTNDMLDSLVNESHLPESNSAVSGYRASLVNYQHELATWTEIANKGATGDFIHYTLAGVYDYYVEVSPAASQAKLSVDGGAGQDKITVATNVPMRAVLSGGSGSDTITSGKRRADLFGGVGNDRLISRSVKGGTLDGGKGSDRYYNRSNTTGTAGEIKVLARNDGDRVVATTGAVPIIRTGVFGYSSISLESYYLVDGSGGQVDLLLLSK